MTDDKIEELKRKKRQLEDELRRATKERFFRTMGTRWSMISAENASAFLNISERTIYRWKASDIWLPRFADLEAINGFLDIVEEVRAASAFFVEVWKKEKISETLPISFKSGLLQDSLRRILENETLNEAEQSEAMTLQLLKNLSAKLTEERKKKGGEKS